MSDDWEILEERPHWPAVFRGRPLPLRLLRGNASEALRALGGSGCVDKLCGAPFFAVSAHYADAVARALIEASVSPVVYRAHGLDGNIIVGHEKTAGAVIHAVAPAAEEWSMLLAVERDGLASCVVKRQLFPMAMHPGHSMVCFSCTDLPVTREFFVCAVFRDLPAGRETFIGLLVGERFDPNTGMLFTKEAETAFRAMNAEIEAGLRRPAPRSLFG